KDAEGRDALPSVTVDASLVQASGLLKDDITLSIPDEAGEFETVLLTEALEQIKASTAAWQHYTVQQSDSTPVKPLLVIQVVDKPSQETLVRTLDTIYATWPELPQGSIANVFGERKELTIGLEKVAYIEPQR